jgi:glycosyltransferase involved in cell wall biosynthesis
MKALFLNHNVVRTGTFVRASCFARELVNEGHEVTVVTTSPDLRGASRQWWWHGVRIIESPDLFSGAARTGWDPWNTLWRTRRLAVEGFDLIHAFDTRPAVILPALSVQQRTGAPLFMDWADWWGRGGTIQERSGPLVRTFFGPVETWFEESFRTRATGNTTIVDTLRERCIALGVPPDEVEWIPNGCVPPNDRPMKQQEARRRLALGGSPLVLHLGVTLPGDSIILFETFRRIRRRLPDARLALVGRFNSRVPPDLHQYVRRVGFVDEEELQHWLAAADVGVLVLRDTVASRGRWPGKLSDYLSGGLPVVMPAVGAAPQVLAAAGAAALCDCVPDAFADTVVALLEDRPRRDAMAEAARALAAGSLAWRAVTTSLLQFYARRTNLGASGAARQVSP